MPPSVHATIRIGTALSGILPTNEYRVVLDGLQERYEPAMSIERSLNGTMHIHRVMSSGDPLLFDGYQYTLLLTREDKDRIAADLGKVVYFMPHYRDETDVSYRSVMVLRSIQDVQNLDPLLNWWKATITLERAHGNEVDS